MNLPNWLNPIVDVLTKPTQFWEYRPTDLITAKQSAVLLLFSDENSTPNLTFIKRSQFLKHHPGQIAFPGGLIEPTDPDLVATALREAQEEIGLNPDSVLPIGALPQISIEVTGFAVTPIISYWQQPHPVSPVATDEVAEVFAVPIEKFILPNSKVWAVKQNYKGPAFLIDEKLIWGFTATVLAELFTAAGLISSFEADYEIEV
jgi:8-oxo-dGTP pyrophosphatase MutT (NUDIX family)